VSIRFKRAPLGFTASCLTATVGMIGFAIVMFWVFTAIFAGMIITHDPLVQLSGLKNACRARR
jgi:peptide/nickel transport system permease protein